jgi:hypothetical protein
MRLFQPDSKGKKQKKCLKIKRSKEFSKCKSAKVVRSKTKNQHHRLSQTEFKKMQHVFVLNKEDTQLYNNITTVKHYIKTGRGTFSKIPSELCDHILSFVYPKYIGFTDKLLINEGVNTSTTPSFCGHMLIPYNTYCGYWDLHNGYIYFRLISSLGKLPPKKVAFERTFCDYIFATINERVMESPYVLSGIIVDHPISRIILNKFCEKGKHKFSDYLGMMNDHIELLVNLITLTKSIYHNAKHFKKIKTHDGLVYSDEYGITPEYIKEEYRVCKTHSTPLSDVKHKIIPVKIYFRDAHDLEFSCTYAGKFMPKCHKYDGVGLPSDWKTHRIDSNFWNFRDYSIDSFMHSYIWECDCGEFKYIHTYIQYDHCCATNLHIDRFGFRERYQIGALQRNESLSYTDLKYHEDRWYNDTYFPFDVHSRIDKNWTCSYELSDAIIKYIHLFDEELLLPNEVNPSFFRSILVNCGSMFCD